MKLYEIMPGQVNVQNKPGEANGKNKPGEANGKNKPGEANGKNNAGEANGKNNAGEANGKNKPGEANGKNKPGEANGENKPGEANGKNKPGEANGKNKATPNSVNVNEVNPRNGLNLSTLPKETFLNYEDAWQEASRKGNFHKLQNMFSTLNNKKILNITDYEGRTPLHYASRYGHNPIIEFLFKKGQDVSQPDKTGLTPLHHAAMGGHVNTVELLLSKGANTHPKDQYGNTPLDIVNTILEGKKVGERVIILNESSRTKYQEIQRMLAAKGGRRCTRKRNKRSKRSKSRKN